MDASTMSPLRRRRSPPRAARLGAGPARQLAIFFGGVIVGALAVAVGLGAPRATTTSEPWRVVAREAPSSAPSASSTPSAAARSGGLASPGTSPVAAAVSASVAAAPRVDVAAASPSGPSAARPAVEDGAALLARAARTSPQKGFGLQLGAYETEAEVAQVLGQHAAALEGIELWVLPVELEGKGTWHRLRVGKLATRREAEALRARLPEDVAAVAIVVSHR